MGTLLITHLKNSKVTAKDVNCGQFEWLFEAKEWKQGLFLRKHTNQSWLF